MGSQAERDVVPPSVMSRASLLAVFAASALGCGAGPVGHGGHGLANEYAEPAVTHPPTLESTSGGAGRVMSRTAQGGVIELRGDHPAALDAASKDMIAHCGEGNYTITEEGEEVIDGGVAWQLHYECATAP